MVVSACGSGTADGTQTQGGATGAETSGDAATRSTGDVDDTTENDPADETHSGDTGNSADSGTTGNPGTADRCQPGPAAPYTFTHDGIDYLIEGGDLFEVDGDRTTFILNLYALDYFDAMYQRVDGELFGISGEDLFPILYDWEDDFSAYGSVAELFPADASGWHHMTAQSPAFPTVEDYNALFECFVAGRCDFVDNRLDLLPRAPGLRFEAVGATQDVDPSKMSIANRLVCFAKGEDVWVTFNARTGDSLPTTILDLESQNLYQSGGPRVVIFDGSLAVQLKFADSPVFAQPEPIPWPANEWVEVTLHLTLDEGEDGAIQLWQDDALVVDTHGRTLPLADIVLNQLEIGISATSDASELEIADLRLSSTPL